MGRDILSAIKRSRRSFPRMRLLNALPPSPLRGARVSFSVLGGTPRLFGSLRVQRSVNMALRVYRVEVPAACVILAAHAAL